MWDWLLGRSRNTVAVGEPVAGFNKFIKSVGSIIG
jgi:hypothetical protein